MPPIENEKENEELEVSLRDQLLEELDAAYDASGVKVEKDQNAEPQSEEDDGQPRDERGRWTKAQQEHYEQQQRDQQAMREQGQQAQDGQGLSLAPPSSWAPAAKAAYATLPPEVQEAVARREQEVNNGFRKLQEYKGLDDYVEMAKSSGTTLKDALDRYRAAEDALEKDFGGGIVQLCSMYGVHPLQLASMFTRAFGGQAGQPQGLPQADPQQSLIARRLAATEETVRTLISERERAEQEAINASLEAFATDHMYFEDVRQDMALLIREGRANTLDEAYDIACRMHPQIRDLLIKEQAAPQNARARVDQARRASSSLKTGAPVGSPSGGSQSNSLREALADAWDSSAGL